MNLLNAEQLATLKSTLDEMAATLRRKLVEELARDPAIDSGALTALSDESPDTVLEYALSYYSQRHSETLGRLEKVTAALADMALGLYGQCAECEEPLSLEQLERDPASRRCASCESRRHASRALRRHVH